jgi:hypothetical protein
MRAAYTMPLCMFIATLAGSAHADDPRGESGLLADLERIVATEESTGWFVDRTSIEAIYAVVLQSVCRTSIEAREGSMLALEGRALRLGDPKVLFTQAGEMTSAVQEALHTARVRDTLRFALNGATKDCPFYIQPQTGYDGRQSDRNRFSLSLETGGLVQLRQTAGTWGYGGGGTARLLPGYGFGSVSILGGFEFAGGAMLRPGNSSSFVINYMPSVPVVLRLHQNLWHYDAEVAAVSLLQADDTRVSFGGRVGIGIGYSALRTRFIIPWAGLALAYEYYADSGGRPAAHFIRGGARLGFQWDP